MRIGSRRAPQWKETPSETQGRWTFHVDNFSREDRHLPPGQANAMFMDFISGLTPSSDMKTAIMAADGSVTREEPRSGWGCVIMDESGNLQLAHGGCKLLLSSMRAEMEAISTGLNLLRSDYNSLSRSAPTLSHSFGNFRLASPLQNGMTLANK